MGFFDKFIEMALDKAPEFVGDAAKAGAGVGVVEAGRGAGQDAAAAALKEGSGINFGAASAPGVAQGGGLQDKRLSETIAPGMQIASQLLGLGGKLSGNPKAENIMNLMAMATGAAGSSSDPQKALKAMEGPMSGITANLQEERAAKDKKLSESLQPNQSLLDRQHW